MTRNRILALIFACALLAGFVARDSIASTCFEWYLKGYCRSCLGGKLSYSEVRYDNGGWILEQPVFATKKSLELGGFRFQAAQARIETAFQWLSRTVDLNIHLDAPHLDIGKDAEELKRIAAIPRGEYRLLHVNTHCDIPKGTFLVHSFSGEKAVPVSFSFNLACHERRSGCAAFWLEEALEKAQGVQMILSETPQKSLELVCNFNHADCSSLLHVLKSIWPQLSYWKLNKGSIDGKAVLTFPFESKPYAEGQLTINDLQMAHTKLDCAIQIPKIALNLVPMQTSQGLWQTAVNANMPKEAFLTFFKNGELFWSFKSFEGSLAFKTDEQASFTFNGLCEASGKSRKMDIEGSASFAEKGFSNVSVGFQLAGKDSNDDAAFHFSARQLGEEWNFAEVEVSGFGKEEFAFAQHIARYVHPQWQHINVLSGSVNAAMLVYFKGINIAEVKIEYIAAHQFQFAYDPLGLVGGVNDALGLVSFDLSDANPINTLNADLKIAEGRLSIYGLKNDLQLAGIQTNLAIRRGLIQKSRLKGEVAGLKGEVEIDETSDNLISLNFSGQAKDLAKTLPDTFIKGINQEFANDRIHIVATAKKHLKGLKFDGSLSIIGENALESNLVAFGFTLEKSPKTLLKRWLSNPVASEYKGSHDAIKPLMPSLAASIAASYNYLSEQNSGIGALVLKDGWFEAENLKLNKYVSPFAFSDNQFMLYGYGDFHGQFNSQNISVQYEMRDFILESVDFAIEVINFRENDKGIQCFYVFDLEKGEAYGEIPILSGTYFEKNSGLLFTDISTQAVLESDALHARDLKSYCNGIYFTGDVDVDWSKPGIGVFEIDMQIQQMHGKVSQVQHFLSHFNQPMFFLKLPIEGAMAFDKGGGHVHFDFQPGDYLLSTHFKGALTDSKLKSQCGNLLLQEVSMNFEYDKKANTFEFSDLQGTLLVGTPDHFEEYSVASDRIYFTDYEKGEAEFDVWLGDKKRDILRLAGRTVPLFRQGEFLIDFKFDHQRTHFGDVHPTLTQLTVKNDWELEDFGLEFDFHLKTLLQDLQRFSRTGFLFLSRSLLKELNEIKTAEGEFKADFNYSGKSSLFNYHISGSDVLVGSQKFQQFLLTGTKKGAIWTVEQLQLDEISIALDILKEEDVWKINFLGAKLGKSLLLGLEGKFNSTNAHLEAKINLLEADLSYLAEWPSLQRSIEDLNLGGKIRANGKIDLFFERSFPKGVHVDIHAKGSLSEGKFKGLCLQDIDDMSFHYTSDKGFEIQEIQTALKSLKDGTTRAGLYLDKASCNFADREFKVDGLYFRIPVDHLGWLADNLQQSFPAAITPTVADTIRLLKNKGEVCGGLKLTIAETNCNLHLDLEKDAYQLFDKEYVLNDFALDCDPFAINISTGYLYQRQQLWLTARSLAPDFNSGELVVAEFSPKKAIAQKTDPLTIAWQIDPHNGYYIQKITGRLCGITCDLAKDNRHALASDYLYFTGKVDLDMKNIQTFLDPETAEKLASWEAGKGYSLQGQWNLGKDNAKSFLDSIGFQGELLGHHFEFFGYQFQHMSANMSYSPHTLNISNLFVADPCGSLQLNEWHCFEQQDGQWVIMIPSILLNDFRPSLLRQYNLSQRRIGKAFVVRKLELNDLHGILGDRHSLKGSGKLTFANPPKKNLQHTIFAIPAELLTRIGLDLAVLTPVRGVIEYEINNAKVVLKRFKDMYSKGRLSKFYLPNNGFESTMDFEGNLNLQVRMKQYNLIFKLAELFTVTVNGTLTKPTYTLARQQKKKAIPAK